jgi:hypothetical protein
MAIKQHPTKGPGWWLLTISRGRKKAGVIMRTLIAITIVLAILSMAQAEIYKCKVDGRTIFMDQPCADGDINQSPYIQTEKNTPSNNQAAQIDQITSQDEQQSAPNQPAPKGATQESISALEAKYFIADDTYNRRKNILEALIRERDIKLEQLELKKYRANNNLAGATWEQSISTEMEAVVRLYNAKIERAQIDKDNAEKERNEIKDQIKTLKTVHY